MCLSVYLSVCVCLSVNKILAERMHQFGRGFRYMVAVCTGSNPIGSKVKVTVTLYPFFLHNSLLYSLPCISALLCLITMNFSKSLTYTLGRFVFKFHKNLMGDDLIMTSFKFS